MDFALLDGVAQWATHKKDGVLFFEGDEIPDDAVPVNPPDEQTLLVAEKLKGKTYSRSEFERLLYSPTQEEILEQRINDLELYILTQEGLI